MFKRKYYILMFVLMLFCSNVMGKADTLYYVIVSSVPQKDVEKGIKEFSAIYGKVNIIRINSTSQTYRSHNDTIRYRIFCNVFEDSLRAVKYLKDSIYQRNSDAWILPIWTEQIENETKQIERPSVQNKSNIKYYVIWNNKYYVFEDSLKSERFKDSMRNIKHDVGIIKTDTLGRKIKSITQNKVTQSNLFFRLTVSVLILIIILLIHWARSRVQKRQKEKAKQQQLEEERQVKIKEQKERQERIKKQIAEDESQTNGYNPNLLDDFCNQYKNPYPYISVPKQINTKIKFSRQEKNCLKGYKEKDFEAYLRKNFKHHGLEIHSNHSVMIADATPPYEPDFTLIKTNINLYIDIEIDEPYGGISREATHYKGIDDDRNQFFNDRGWIVIRFSERQVHLQPEQCCAFIAGVIKQIDNTYIIPPELQKQAILFDDPIWTKEQAEQWAKENYREKYLGIDSFWGKNISNINDNLRQTEAEIKIEKEILSTYQPTASKSNYSSGRYRSSNNTYRSSAYSNCSSVSSYVSQKYGSIWEDIKLSKPENIDIAKQKDVDTIFKNPSNTNISNPEKEKIIDESSTKKRKLFKFWGDINWKNVGRIVLAILVVITIVLIIGVVIYYFWKVILILALLFGIVIKNN